MIQLSSKQIEQLKQTLVDPGKKERRTRLKILNQLWKSIDIINDDKEILSFNSIRSTNSKFVILLLARASLLGFQGPTWKELQRLCVLESDDDTEFGTDYISSRLYQMLMRDNKGRWPYFQWRERFTTTQKQLERRKILTVNIHPDVGRYGAYQFCLNGSAIEAAEEAMKRMSDSFLFI